jgi:hypothetical protein
VAGVTFIAEPPTLMVAVWLTRSKLLADCELTADDRSRLMGVAVTERVDGGAAAGAVVVLATAVLAGAV